MSRAFLAVAAFVVIAGFVGQANAWQLAYKEGGVCVTFQSATNGDGQMEIAYLPQQAYLIKFNSSGTVGDKIKGVVSVQKSAKWTDYPVKLQVVNDAVMGVAAYSYEGMPDPLRAAIGGGSALKYGDSEFSLTGSSAALKEIFTCVTSRG